MLHRGLLLSQLSVQLDTAGIRTLALLLVGQEEDFPPTVREMIAMYPVRLIRVAGWRQACEPALLASVDAVILCEPAVDNTADHEVWRRNVQLLADALKAHRLTGIVLASDTASRALLDENGLMLAPTEISPGELWGRVVTIQQYRPLLHQMEEQVAVMQRLGKNLNQQFVEVDQELRLASRLQRDFLPRSLPEINDVRFAAIFRPAAWVSGDIYDVSRLDETHVGFYLADAVGHGIAAGLLTMFIKQAVVGKVVEQDRYRLLPPGEVLARLNTELARQELPNCQFVTACYACLDAATHQLTFARGGHPHPIHVNATGQCSEVRTIGGLLGVFEGETYPGISLKLEPGEKLIFYSDGLEDVIIAGRDRQHGTVEFTSDFMQIVRNPVQEFTQALATWLDQAQGSLSPTDDVTVLAVERLPA
jgi:serine phosphatase RsbU (regulator of sigma subunit)